VQDGVLDSAEHRIVKEESVFPKKSMKTRSVGVLLGVMLLGLVATKADTESPNWTFVAAATTDGTTWHGDRYAKCIPTGMRGTDGVTKIYRVEKDKDVLEHAYDWYAIHVYISGASEKTSVVRFGPWSQGHQASSNDLALAFYYDGRLLKSYSTLDIVGRPDNVSSSISHYGWCQRIGGYDWIVSASSPTLIWGFTLKTQDGRTLCFSVKTGELVRDGKPESREQNEHN
jgi:hypothetical protein